MKSFIALSSVAWLLAAGIPSSQASPVSAPRAVPQRPAPPPVPQRFPPINPACLIVPVSCY